VDARTREAQRLIRFGNRHVSVAKKARIEPHFTGLIILDLEHVNGRAVQIAEVKELRAEGIALPECFVAFELDLHVCVPVQAQEALRQAGRFRRRGLALGERVGTGDEAFERGRWRIEGGRCTLRVKVRGLCGSLRSGVGRAASAANSE